MKRNLSVVILTFNEELHITRCIESLLAITSNIFIVDSFSSDKTVEIAESLGAKVFQRKWKNYADQFQWGLDNCSIDTEWVMRIDADEFLDNTMQGEMVFAIESASNQISGYVCKLRNIYLGRTIRFGGYDPLKLLRVWRHKRGRIESRWMDEHIVLSYGRTELLPGEIIHNNLNNHFWWTEKHNKYADREAIDAISKRYKLFEVDDQIVKTDNPSAKIKRYIKDRIYNRLPIFFGPTLYFLYRYLLCLGFLDGKEGFAYHFCQAFWYRIVVDIRILEAEKLISTTGGDRESVILVLEKLTGHKIGGG
ncbi:MAG: glycosyltransferase family 2 protein [Porticoccaceae bacterium]